MNGTTNGRHDDDDDLKDLIGKKKKQQEQNVQQHDPSFVSTLLGLLNYHIHSCCFFYPVVCGVITVLFVFILMWIILSTITNPTQEYGIIYHDHSNLNSKLNLQMSDIDHWCLGGGNDNCQCDDPLTPMPRTEHASWILAFKQNLKKIDTYRATQSNPDVVFLGESVIEEMEGRWLGKSGRSNGLQHLAWMFKEHFGKHQYLQQKTNNNNVDMHREEPPIDGVAFGIAGDTSANVLWRIMHGEMPIDFNPRVWWISLGMNDLARMRCSEEVVLIGILRVVEEIIERKPDTHIVLNSLFPITTLRGSEYPVISDVEDSFTDEENEAKPDGRKQRQLYQSSSYYARSVEESAPAKDLAEKAEKEEIARDKQVRKKRKKRSVPSKPEILRDVGIMKKFRFGRLGKKKLPLWTSVRAINAQLKSFAEKHKDRVTYFDATGVFIERNGDDRLILRHDRTSSKGHPTIEGFRQLEIQMLDFLQPLLANLDLKDANDDVMLHYKAVAKGDTDPGHHVEPTNGSTSTNKGTGGKSQQPVGPEDIEFIGWDRNAGEDDYLAQPDIFDDDQFENDEVDVPDLYDDYDITVDDEFF